ncbi:MAG: type II toxin-antitoxin system Phd/YefM family antitoxin [Cyanobacterium sp.]
MKIELKKIEDNPKILEKIIEGIEELIITENERPIYKLTKINQPIKKRRIRGSAKDLITISVDFDEPLPEFTEYM